MSSTLLPGRIATLSIVGTLFVSTLLVSVGAVASGGAVGTGPLTPAVSDAGNDPIGAIDPIGTSNADAPSAPAAIGRPPAQADERNRITFDHTEGERASYEVTVSGSIEAGPEADLEDAESVDTISGNRATGSVAEGGDDDYFFTGEITSLDVDGPLTVYVNGERVDPDDFDGATTTDTTTTASTTTSTTTTTTTSTPTETETATPTPTDTETPAPTPTETAATPTATPSPTAAPNASTTAARPTTPAANSGSEGFTEQERGLFLTIGGVLLLGVLAIGGFVWFARQG